jgi:hypothetical protein
MEETLKFVEEKCGSDVFENAIRRFGVVNACEWFGHPPRSDFTEQTIKILNERLNPIGEVI